MKTTPFTDIHTALGAKMHEFAGYNMPIEYSGIMDEHHAVVNSVGVFDVSHMGEFLVSGPKALEFLQRVTSNDASVLKPGKAQYTSFLNEEGGIVDDFIVYALKPEKYLMVVNAANIEKDWAWCQQWNTMGAHLEDVSDQNALLAVQGPNAKETLQKLTEVDLSTIPFYSFALATCAGVENVLISNTGYTGAGGFELYFHPDGGKQVWDALFEAGKEFNIRPAGLGARDTLRLEMGFCLYGNDLDETTTPLQAGLGWITKFVDEKPFVGREALTKEMEDGITRKLCCFEMIDRHSRQGYDIMHEEEGIIGHVTSVPCPRAQRKESGWGT